MAICGARSGQFAPAHCATPHPPERRGAADRAGDARRRCRGDSRGEPFVARLGAAAAGAELVQHAEHGEELHRQRTVDGGVARAVDFRAGVRVIGRILKHLGLWAPRAMQRSPPLGPEAWPAHASLPLTYHPVPDIV